MKFKLKPLAEILKLTKEGLDEALAPIRARQIKAEADKKSADIEAQIIGKQREVQELCTSKDINFDKLIDAMDEIALLERRRDQYGIVIQQLFPEK